MELTKKKEDMSNLKNNVLLVPTDFTEAADCAINHAIGLAKAGNFDLKLVHIINDETKKSLKKEKHDETFINQKLNKISSEILDKEGVKTHYLSREGSIFRIIGQISEEDEIRYMFMGTHGVVGIQKIVGAFAIKVVSSVVIPTIITQKKDMRANGYKKIVLPIDATIENKQKLTYAVDLAKIFNSEIHLLLDTSTVPDNLNDLKFNKEYSEKLLQQKGVKYTVGETLPGEIDFGKQVLNYASKIDADIIIIMTKQRGGLKDIFVGPFEEFIINNPDQIPVMCVNPSNKNVTYEYLGK